MPLMESRRRYNESYNVVLGPCPGCDLWQVDYTDAVQLSYGTYPAFCDALEGVLAEHLDECPELQLILEGGLFRTSGVSPEH